MPRAARHNDPSHVGSSDASDVTGSGSLACAVAEMCPVFAPCDGKEREGGGREGGREGEEGKEGGEGEKRGNIGESGEVFLCVHAAFFVAISAWHPTPIFRRVAPVPLPVHASCTLLRRLPMLSEKARSLLRDFMLVFDLDNFFKGSTEVTESDAAKTLEYIKSVFEQANLLAPTTYMTSDGLLKRLKSLRSPKQQFKKEHGATYELIKCAFDLCHIDTTDGLLPAIIKAKGKPAPAYFVPKGVMSRKLNDETAERAAAKKEWAEEKKLQRCKDRGVEQEGRRVAVDRQRDDSQEGRRAEARHDGHRRHVDLACPHGVQPGAHQQGRGVEEHPQRGEAKAGQGGQGAHVQQHADGHAATPRRRQRHP